MLTKLMQPTQKAARLISGVLQEYEIMKCLTKFILLITCLTCGCGPTLYHPLAKPGEDARDDRIYGTWLYVEKGKIHKAQYVHIGFNKETKETTVLFAGVSPKGKFEKWEFTGHTSIIRGNNYFSTRFVEECKPSKSYAIVKYEIKNNVIIIYIMESEPFDKAVEAGEIKGKIEKDDIISNTVITDSPKRIKQFILENEKELFSGKSIKLYKINAEHVFAGDSRPVETHNQKQGGSP